METETKQKNEIQKIFDFEVLTPGWQIDGLLWIISIIVSVLLGRFLASGNPIGSLIWTLVFIGYGLLSGWLWGKFGRYLSNRLIINPLEKMVEEHSSQQGWFNRYLIGDQIDRAFIQLESQNLDVESLRSIFYKSFRIIIAFASMMLIIGNIFLFLFGNPNNGFLYLIFGFILAFPGLGIYLPLAMIIEDSRIMVVQDDKSIRFAGGKIRDILDGIFGITGIASGFKLLNVPEYDIATNIFFYIFILCILLLFSIGALFPALWLYFREHENIVNEFRDKAIKTNIFPAKTNVARLTSEEIQKLVLGEVRTPTEVKEDGLIGKIKNVTGLSEKRRKFTENELERLQENGAWVCDECSHVNSSIIDIENCEECGTSRKR